MYGVLIACIGEGESTDTFLLDRVQSKASRLINSSSLTVFNFFLFAGMWHLLLSSIAVFLLTALLILLTACLPFSCGLVAQNFTLILTNSLYIINRGHSNVTANINFLAYTAQCYIVQVRDTMLSLNGGEKNSEDIWRKIG